ncbi:putative mus7 mms22 family protein [Erysiphe neolycopersici]|uniref:Putative mus7 mms22 family protein n=1 Tax=Erysiphe neolycopersici TaxID=212602 RepID=A0A420HVT6_9PEZI|nr:putative mus7 mms22 family protein [Erysiphe neolycopersici]
MTNWKDNGYVPDSDDDFSIDSDEKISPGGYENEIQDNEFRASQKKHSRPGSDETWGIDLNTEKNIATLTTRKFPANNLSPEVFNEGNINKFPVTEHKSWINKSSTRLSIQESIKDVFFNQPDLIISKETSRPEDLGESPKTPINAREGGIALTLFSSPSYSKVFKAPNIFWEDIGDEKDIAGAVTPQKDQCMHDEVSKSYVQISSRSSSTLSSPPSTLPDYLDFEGSKLPVPNTTRQDSQNRLDANGFPSTRLGEHEIYHESDYPMKRALRQRNLIQLHPYVVEQEKYRQTLKSRGMIPLRIVPSQDHRNHRSHNSLSPSYHSTEEYSQHNRDNSTSKVNDQALNIVSSLCSTDTFGHLNNINSSIDLDAHRESHLQDDEYFPDLNTLARKRHHQSPTPKKIRGNSNLSTKPLQRFFNLSNSSSQSVEYVCNGRDSDSQISVVQSSLNLQSEKQHLPSLPRIISISSLDSNPTLIPGNDSEIDITTNLTTFTTQAPTSSRPIKELSTEHDIDFDVDDPFISDPKEASSVQSDSDESMIIRQVSRKIRGVLPASHLRLDAHSQTQKLYRTTRNDHNISAISIFPRKGIALPKSRNSTQTQNNLSSGLKFLAENSDFEANESDEGDGYIVNGILREEDSTEVMNHTLNSSKFDLIEEEDIIDRMLPTRSRQSLLKAKNKRSKYNAGGLERQTRITAHLKRSREGGDKSRGFIKRVKSNNLNHVDRKSQHRAPSIPQLSIVDVIDYAHELPTFIRIAARTARSRRSQGRHSPSRKFIRLSTIDDTQDVQAILTDWKRGNIVPGAGFRMSQSVKENIVNQSCEISKYQNLYNQSSSREISGSNLNLMKRSIKNVNFQQSIDDFITSEQVIRVNDIFPKQQSRRRELIKRNKVSHNSFTRPAQLESSDHQFLKNSSSAFKILKKKLDLLYARSLRHPAERSNLQLNRFLQNSEVSGTIIRENLDGHNYRSHQMSLPTRVRQKKRPPNRLSAGAERYRQPSHPLVLESLNDKKREKTSNECKLYNLGKLGTKYPIHFGIFPLQSGVFFHNSTYIGSGRLRDVMEPNLYHSTQSRENFSLKVGEKIFSWCSWNETSASEMGVCFDLLLDYFLSTQISNLSMSESKEIITFVLNYAQQNSSYHETLDQYNFLQRMTQVLHEFLSRINITLSLTVAGLEEKTFVIVMSSVLTFHLLQLARANKKASSLKFELEDLLIKMTSQCASLLLLDGLQSVQKLYDNLQYHSYRKSGISSKQIGIEGWVIIIKILSAAGIPRGSFWDVVNNQLQLRTVGNLSDAAEMEKLWYSMYLLLPLCEFDNLGRIVSGQRQTVSFDNWSIPQYLLKRVLGLYSSNPRQSSGFNEYLRSLLIRCHYLMVEWGWWKTSSFIGSVFDFFASQNFSHLRNEEVYHSPSFLEKLDTEPSLGVEPEDCCFHIFLKIVALQFLHLRQISDVKSIRNLGPRLLPNHDRQYPKEEDIHQRDLASLRNHHDLLCTLFWSMPPEQRPSITLIQELVIADCSHREACMINLQSWENLTRFLVTSTLNSNLYQPFKNWQSTFFSGVYKQFLGAEKDVRQQAGEIYQKSGNLMNERRISEVLLTNKKNLVAIMCRCIQVMGNTIKTIKCDLMLKQALNFVDLLLKAMDPYLHNEDHFSNSLLTEIIQVLMYSMDQNEKLYQSGSNESMCNNLINEDSQDSIDMNNWSHLEMISLLETLLDYLRPVIKLRINKSSSKSNASPSKDSINVRLIDCWGRLISTVTQNEAQKFQSNLILEADTVFENRKSCSFVNHYWPLFIAKLLYYGKSLDEFKFPGFDIGLEWLLSMVDVEVFSMPKISLTLQLHQKGYYLCKTLDLHKLDRGQIMRAAIREMSNLLTESSIEVIVGLKKKHAQRYFSDILGEVMNFMQQTLESLDSSSDRHRTYLNFTRGVITNIKRYASDFRSITKFFIHPSAHYWPDEADPNLYAAGIVSYCVRLGQQPEKTSFELFYYLHSGWMNALMTHRLNEYSSYLIKGMKCKEFAQFMLVDFIPAILEVGFRMNDWLLCSTFLPTLGYRIRRLMDSPGPNSLWAFEQFLNILKIIINGTINLLQKFPSYDDIRGAHPEHRGILAVTYQFWMQNASTMCQYMENHPQITRIINQVTNLLNSFIYKALESFEPDYKKATTPDQFSSSSLPLSSKFENLSTGKYHDKFIDFLTHEILDCWQLSSSPPFRVIIRTRSREFSPEFMFPHTLKEVLQGELPVYLNLFECLDRSIKLKERPNSLIEQIVF